MPKKSFKCTDEEIIKVLKGEKFDGDKCFEDFYEKTFPDIRRLVLGKGGGVEDINEVFHNGLCILIEKVRQGNFKGKGELSAFLFGICRNLWYQMFQRKSTDKKIKNADELKKEVTVDPSISIINKQQRAAIIHIFEKLGDRCKKLLTMYINGYPLREIADKMNLKDKQGASNGVYKCFKKLRELSEENEGLWDFLID